MSEHWQRMHGALRRKATSLQRGMVPMEPGTYAWYRSGDPTYVGATDELGYHAMENVVHVRDLHATMLHLLGIRHQRFSYPFQGLDMKLTGVEPARVLEEVLA